MATVRKVSISESRVCRSEAVYSKEMMLKGDL